jgi:hypothetical protein
VNGTNAVLEDTLTPEEEKLVLKGERQLRQGKYVLWEDTCHPKFFLEEPESCCDRGSGETHRN